MVFFLFIGRWRYLFPIAFTYIGTVVGAGFASGQEILHFFTRYGLAGKVGILLTACLFALFGSRMMILGARLNATSYKEVNEYLFGDAMAKYMNLLVGVMLFGVTGAMISGIGAIFKEQFHLPSLLGMGLTIIIGVWILKHGLEGILSLNTIVVPIMALFTLLMVLNSVNFVSAEGVGAISPAGGWMSSLFSALTYVSYNLAMAQAILVPMGREIGDEDVLIWGGVLGAIFLGMLLLGSDFAIGLRGEVMLQFDIPMAAIIASMGKFITVLFLFVVIIEIFTTFIANVYGLGIRLAGWLSLDEKVWIWIIVLSGLLFAQIGFQAFITQVYPLFGYCGFLYMVMLVMRKKRK